MQKLPLLHENIPNVRIAQFMLDLIHEDEIEAIVANGPQAIVIHGTGLGHLPIDDPGKDAPENTKVWRALTRCVNRNIPVVITSWPRLYNGD